MRDSSTQTACSEELFEALVDDNGVFHGLVDDKHIFYGLVDDNGVIHGLVDNKRPFHGLVDDNGLFEPSRCRVRGHARCYAPPCAHGPSTASAHPHEDPGQGV